jgi:hypothetical protein
MMPTFPGPSRAEVPFLETAAEIKINVSQRFFIPNCTANTKAYSNDKNYNVQIVHIWYNKGALGKQRRVTKQRFRELNAIIALEGC